MTSTNQLDLDTIEARAEGIASQLTGWLDRFAPIAGQEVVERARHALASDPNRLVAEVRRLRAQVADQRAYEQRLREQHDLDVAALATARANALTAGADAIDDMERRNAWPVRPVDAGICSEFLRGMAAGSQPAEESHVVADDSDDPEHVDDCPGCRPGAPAARSAAV